MSWRILPRPNRQMWPGWVEPTGSGGDRELKAAAFLPLPPSLPTKFRYKAGSSKARSDLRFAERALVSGFCACLCPETGTHFRKDML